MSTSEDGSLVFKPTLAPEVKFYRSLASDPVFASLRPHIPKFYGTLRGEGRVEGGDLVREPAIGERDEFPPTWKAAERPSAY